MDATRLTIRRIVTGQRLQEEIEDVELYTQMQPGFKGMYLDGYGWVTWPVTWPEGTPHHDDVRETHLNLPHAYAATAVSIAPRNGDKSSEKWEVNVTSSEDIWGVNMRFIIDFVDVVDSNSQLYVETPEGDYGGTINGFYDEWEKMQDEEDSVEESYDEPDDEEWDVWLNTSVYNFMRPEFKGMLLNESGWVTWKAEWPEGSPHHSEIQRAQFPDEDYIASVSIAPHGPPWAPASRRWEVNIGAFAPLWSDQMRKIVEFTAQVPHQNQMYVEVWNPRGPANFEGTVEEYLQQWQENQ